MDRPVGTERRDLFVSRPGPGRLHELAGEDMRFCLDMAGRRPGELRALDFVEGAIQLLPHLGSPGPAWRDAMAVMGTLRTALRVLVTDANRDQPATPVRKPGEYLCDLTRRHQAGRLDLVGNLIGLVERRGGR